MDRMNERFAPNMVAVPLDRYESLIKAGAMLEAMLAEYDRGTYHSISSETVKNARAVLYDEYEEAEADA